jgi:hypothetical protein
MSTEFETLEKQTPISKITEFPLSIIHVSSKKMPYKPWTEYQSKVAPIEGWHPHYLKQGYVGIICGAVSGSVEIIDIDVKNDPNKTIWDEYKALIPASLLSRLIIQNTVNDGYHLAYRCPEATIDKNQKLAKHTNEEVLIETRGEGGYFCTHSIDYKVIQGTFDLANLNVDIPVITPQERNQLLEIARSLTRDIQKQPKKPFSYSITAINNFNEQFNIIELFTKHDWALVKEDDEKVYLKRNGSLATHSGYYFKDTKTFFCFSTSTEFIAGKPYNNFQVLQVLEGKDDFRTTVRLLSDLGFAVEGRAEKVTSDDIADYLNGIGLKYDAFIQDLTFNGKVVDEKDYNTIYIDLKKHFGKEIARTRFEEVAKSNYISEVHPVQDYIKANMHRKPSGTFEQWFGCLTLKNQNVDKTALLHFVKKWYVGMVAQALDGEFANEIFLTFLSVEQGIGKTTLLRKYTLPEALQGYRVEHSLSFDDDFKVLMGQSILIIDDEMDGRTFEQGQTFKNIISNKYQTLRRKYDRRISTIKRRCSFAGSGNNLLVVRDKLDRRILPIEIAKIDHQMLNAIDLDDLFMEAYNLFSEGFQYSFQSGDKCVLNPLYEDYIQLSDIDLILDDYLELPEDKTDGLEVACLDLVSFLISRFPQFSRRINVPTIARQMNDRGFTKTRKGKKKITTYIIGKSSKITELLNNDSQSVGSGKDGWEPWFQKPINPSQN